MPRILTYFTSTIDRVVRFVACRHYGSRLANMLIFLFLSGISWFLKIYLLIVFGLISYNCLYLAMFF